MEHDGERNAHASESASNFFGLEIPKRQKVVMVVGLRLSLVTEEGCGDSPDESVSAVSVQLQRDGS